MWWQWVDALLEAVFATILFVVLMILAALLRPW